jgi:hypothetical protein
MGMIYVAAHTTDDGDIPLGYYTSAAAACKRVEMWEEHNDTGESFTVCAYEVDAGDPAEYWRDGNGLREYLIYDYRSGGSVPQWREVDVTDWAAHG